MGAVGALRGSIGPCACAAAPIIGEDTDRGADCRGEDSEGSAKRGTDADLCAGDVAAAVGGAAETGLDRTGDASMKKECCGAASAREGGCDCRAAIMSRKDLFCSEAPLSGGDADPQSPCTGGEGISIRTKLLAGNAAAGDHAGRDGDEA
mmetsp:Transcript_9611/g.34140  ORF Transcript_9611/g.34140 Transcript_9611/m.34140 type:complete len:150 (-) Transcript_9611:3217-3666(-)